MHIGPMTLASFVPISRHRFVNVSELDILRVDNQTESRRLTTLSGLRWPSEPWPGSDQ
jgi:hypothetical protein